MLSDEQREAEDAATRLQAISRGHRDRQTVERTQTLKKEREQAASLLQTRQRGRIACREVDERREQTQAATSIGRIYRGKQTRRARIDRGPRSCDRDDVASGLHTLGRTADLRHAYLGCSLTGLQLIDVDVLQSYEHLQALDVASNHLTSLAALEHLPYLTRLNASSNKLSQFDVEVPRNEPGENAWTLGSKHAGSNLIEVDLSDNEIEVLGAQETHRRLEKLVLDGNRMYEITGLANLARLKVLSMRNNDLTYVSGLETLSALVDLDVGGNQLTRLGEGLENLVNLRRLGVAGNQITTLDGLEPLQALDELDARDNCIEKVREVEYLERLPLFSSLLLQGNPCSDLPFYRRRVVFRLQQLRTLDGIAVSSDDKIKAINLHGGDESDLKHRQETFRKHFGSALEFEDPLPPFVEPERSPFDVDLCDLPGLEMYLRTIFEAADTSGDGEISVGEAIKAVRNDDDFAEMMGFGQRTKVRQADGTREQLTEMMQSLDTDGDNKVSWQEFREAFLGPLEDEENEREAENEYLDEYAAYLKVVFDRVDVDGSGSLSYGELVKALRDDPEFAEGSGFKDSGLSREEFADRMLDALDWDWSDEIEWEEFRDAALDSAMEALERQKMEDYVQDIFARVDVSGDGAISVAEAVKACRNDDDFAEAMGFDGRVKIREGWTKEQLIESLAEMDTDGDCSISWDEFRKALLGPWDDDDDVEPPLPPDANVEALETYLRGIFARVDTSGDGAISVSEAASALRDDEEFAEVLGVDVGTDDVFRAIDALDEDGDQRVSWGEFRGAVLGATPWGAE